MINRLGTLYIEQSRFGEAEACFQRALAIRIAKLGPNHSRVGQTLKHLLTLYELQVRILFFFFWKASLLVLPRGLSRLIAPARRRSMTKQRNAESAL